MDGLSFELDACELRYERDFRQVFILDELASLDLVGMGDGKCEIDFSEVECPVEILVSRVRISQNERVLRAIPRSEPINLKFSDGIAKEVKGYFSGLPEDLLSGREIIFSHGEILITVRVFKRDGQSDLGEIGRLCGEFIVTGSRSGSEAMRLLKLLGTFLMFVRGSRVGLGHISTIDSAGTLLEQARGFSKSDTLSPTFSWFTTELQSSLPLLFENFLSASGDTALRKVLIRAIYFYRSSNVSQTDSSELAIVSSYAALELLVSYVLEEKAKWSTALMGPSTKFADKLRATFGFYGIDEDPMAGLGALNKFARKKNITDAHEALAKIRNGIVHPKEESGIDGKVLLEAWSMSQWMVEVLIFILLKYRGKMQDRRDWGGWKGATKPVPSYR